jgi:hypothetical protein
MATTTTTRTTKKATARKPTTTAKKPAARKPAARKTTATAKRTTARTTTSPKKAVTAVVEPVDTVKSTETGGQDGVLKRFLGFTMGSIEDATLGLGGNALGAIPGLPKGVTEKIQSGQAKVVKGTTGQIESVTLSGASVVGKGLSVMFAPIRKLIR